MLQLRAVSQGALELHSIRPDQARGFMASSSREAEEVPLPDGGRRDAEHDVKPLISITGHCIMVIL